MTALTQFERLEASGLYTPAEGAQRRDVVLSLGNASLTLTDHREVALAHWSLAAIERLNPGRRPAVFAPAPDAPERVEVADDLMIDAIEKIRKAVLRGRPHPGRLRRRLTLAGIVLGIAVAVLWLPGALIATTARIVPDAVRISLGERLLTEITAVAGRACAEPEGRRALDGLLAALGGAGPRRAVVLPGGPPGTRHLPGGIVLLNRGVVEDHETPEVVAGFLLAEAERMAAVDPLKRLMEDAGAPASLRLATTGRLPDAALRHHAETVMLAPGDTPAAEHLAPRFAEARVPMTPYAYALDITGENTLPLIEADPLAGGAVRPLLRDADWVALQGICG